MVSSLNRTLAAALILTAKYALADSSGELRKFKDQDFEVTVNEFVVGAPGKNVLVIPPTGGTNVIDKSYAKALAKKGFRVFILESWTDHDEYNIELSIHTRFYARAQRAIETVVKHIPEDQPIGILGTSVGGIHAAIAAGRIPRITRAMVITGGADIASVITDSDQLAMVDVKKKRMDRYKFRDRDAYLTELRKVIELEPLRLGPGYQGKKLGMVISREDTTVPGKNQELLLDLWKPEHVLELKNNHFWAIVRTWLFNSDFVVDFF